MLLETLTSAHEGAGPRICNETSESCEGQMNHRGRIWPVLLLVGFVAGLPVGQSPSLAATKGTYTGSTSQGRLIRVEVGNAGVECWTVDYDCAACCSFAATTSTNPAPPCAITSENFSCGSTGCVANTFRQMISGTFHVSPASVAGLITINHQPGATPPCCQLTNMSWSSTSYNGITPRLLVNRSGADTVLSWNNIAVKYDVVRGSLDVLRSSAGNFALAKDLCVENDLFPPTITTPTVQLVDNTPASGGLFWLVRGDRCGGRTYNSGGQGQVGDRDSEIDVCTRDSGALAPGSDSAVEIHSYREAGRAD